MFSVTFGANAMKVWITGRHGTGDSNESRSSPDRVAEFFMGGIASHAYKPERPKLMQSPDPEFRLLKHQLTRACRALSRSKPSKDSTLWSGYSQNPTVASCVSISRSLWIRQIPGVHQKTRISYSITKDFCLSAPRTNSINSSLSTLTRINCSCRFRL